MIRFLVLTLAVLFVLPASPSLAQPDSGPRDRLEAELAALAREAGGTLGVKVVHLESGRSAGLNSTGRFPMASVYKLPIAVVVLARVDAGGLRLDQEVEVKPGELRRTGSTVDAWTPGGRVPLARLVETMMTRSDNTACDVLLRLLGGARAVDAWLDAHGYPEIDVSWSELMMAAAASGVADLVKDGECGHACLDALVARVPKEKRAAAALSFARDPRNTASPDDLARFVADLLGGRLLSPGSTESLLAMMRANRTGDRRIRALLPKGTRVGDKTGTMGGSANDVGFVGLPDGKGTLVVVALVRDSTRDAAAKDRAIARAAKAAFDAFAR